ncbi:hypothetical protein BDR04DRAFT_500505 [Suillus decipiens]|nr:hypothetical protein BDR04DRAFT_500505 [Suillus decipiens]
MQQNLHHNQHVDPNLSLSPQNTRRSYVFFSAKQGHVFSNRLHAGGTVFTRQILERRANLPGPAKNDYCNEAKLLAHTPTLVSPTFISVDLHVHIALHCANKFQAWGHAGVHATPTRIAVTQETVDAHRVYSSQPRETALLLIRCVEVVPTQFDINVASCSTMWDKIILEGLQQCTLS